MTSRYDTTIVTVALPHIQVALGFSGPNQEWVANAYAVAFGGSLVHGGRAGDLLGRRRIFIPGAARVRPALADRRFAADQKSSTSR